MMNILYCILLKFNDLYIRSGTNNQYCDMFSCDTEAYCLCFFALTADKCYLHQMEMH